MPTIDRNLKISRILHAGYIFEYQDMRVIFDPLFENPFSRNCYAFPDVQFNSSRIQDLKFSAIFISHYHDDHFSLESLNFLDRQTPIYMYSVFPEFFSLLRSMGFSEVHSLVIDAPVQIGALKITPRKALDADVDSLFHVQAGKINVLNVVDSWIDPETLNKLILFSPWDLVLWPFQTMREVEVLSPHRVSWIVPELPWEWVSQLQALNPKWVVPSSCQFLQESWSWYNKAMFPISYVQFQQWVQSILPKTQVTRMNPGASFVLNLEDFKEVQGLSWVLPQGEQNVDYLPDPEFQIPATASIAQKFSALNEAQKQKVFSYCSEEVLEKYRSLGAPNDPYFHQPRKWRLSLYNHQGQETHFYYDMNGEYIVLEEFCAEEHLSWTTEVSEAKLHDALIRGESLTSMYMRINGQFFSPQVEKELEFVDFLEDPLVRCLFSRDVASYQRAQLDRISLCKVQSVVNRE